MEGANQNISSSAFVDATSTNQALSPPQIFKLNVDCFEHLFEWLSLNELLVFRQTCKRMKQVVDYYIKLNYPHLLRLNIYNRRRWLDFHNERLNYFEWIKHLSIDTDGLIINLTLWEIESIAYVLNRLEGLKLHGVRINDDLYEVILKHCPHLKYLNVTAHNFSDLINDTKNEWLSRQYPMLEHFEMHIGNAYTRMDPFIEYITIAKLVTFFKQNPQIRIFSIDSDFLEKIHRSLLEFNIQFDRLDIYRSQRLHSICNVAKILYEKQIYKRLHLYSNQPNFIGNDEHYLSAFGNLEKVHFHSVTGNSPIPVVASIKELSIGWLCAISNDILKMMAENFIDLRRVDMQYAHMCDIRSFVCHAPKLRQIRVVELFHTETPTISGFITMNEERKKLVNACKVKILIGERDFLRFKWTGKINFSLIELKRTDMYRIG